MEVYLGGEENGSNVREVDGYGSFARSRDGEDVCDAQQWEEDEEGLAPFPVLLCFHRVRGPEFRYQNLLERERKKKRWAKKREKLMMVSNGRIIHHAIDDKKERERDDRLRHTHTHTDSFGGTLRINQVKSFQSRERRCRSGRDHSAGASAPGPSLPIQSFVLTGE